MTRPIPTQMPKFHMEVVDGKTWHYVHAPLCEFLAINIQAKVWHLWDNEDYFGHFPTRKALLEYIKRLCTKEEQMFTARELKLILLSLETNHRELVIELNRRRDIALGVTTEERDELDALTDKVRELFLTA